MLARTRSSRGSSSAVSPVAWLSASPRPAREAANALMKSCSARRPSGLKIWNASSMSTLAAVCSTGSSPPHGMVSSERPGVRARYLPPSTDASRTSAVESSGSGATFPRSCTSRTACAGRSPDAGTASLPSTWPTRAPPMRTSAFLLTLPASGTAMLTRWVSCHGRPLVAL